MFSIQFTGDVLMVDGPSEEYWNNNELIENLKESDFLAGNLEMVISGKSQAETWASTFCGGCWLAAEDAICKEINSFGFNYFNVANNHFMEFNYKGAKSTCAKLDSNNILHTGYGENLLEASKPVYREINNIKVAFISCTASCDDSARAGYQSPTVPGRPGLNVLRHSQKLYVTPEKLAVIDSIAEETCINARFMKAVEMGIHSLDPAIHRLGRLQFIEGTENKKVTECNKKDLNRIISEIIQAKSNGAKCIFVSVHSHDIKGMTDDTPDDYLEEFAHACVEAGASAIIGTGTHQLKGVEIYKGVPIFYSLANFCFSDEILRFVPADYYERYNLDYNCTMEEMWNVISKNETVGLEYDEKNYRSVIPYMQFNDDGKLEKLILKPIELGFVKQNRLKGYPYCADQTESKKIFDTLNHLSYPYGTEISYKDKFFEVKI